MAVWEWYIYITYIVRSYIIFIGPLVLHTFFIRIHNCFVCINQNTSNITLNTAAACIEIVEMTFFQEWDNIITLSWSVVCFRTRDGEIVVYNIILIPTAFLRFLPPVHTVQWNIIYHHFSWLSLLENSKWFTYLNAILKAAVVAVSAIDKEGKPVLVHCSDGWDRTTQIIALAELLLDPYYRTVEVSWLKSVFIICCVFLSRYKHFVVICVYFCMLL